jgi:hypothetical protein
MAPLPLFAAASGLWKSFTGDKKGPEELKSALSAVFGEQENLHIALDDFAEPLGEALPAASGLARRGGEGEGAWIEWAHSETATLPDATFSAARWRFYRSGLVIFNGGFETTRGGFDRGDLLGHRIELATEDGLTLGAWLAGFFVRPEAANKSYVSTTQIAHAALERHFDDLAASQNGMWFRRR